MNMGISFIVGREAARRIVVDSKVAAHLPTIDGDMIAASLLADAGLDKAAELELA